MKLLFKQRFFSWFDSYDIYDESGATVFTVEGQLSWGHKLHILNAAGEHIGTVKEVVLTFLPKFEFYVNGQHAGALCKEFSLFQPRYTLEGLDWQVTGDFMGWDYNIETPTGHPVATIRKELLHWTDTYTIDVDTPEHALTALMIVLAIDAEKCSKN